MEPSRARNTDRNRARRGSTGKNLGGRRPVERSAFKHSSLFSRCLISDGGQSALDFSCTGPRRSDPQTASRKLLR